MNPLCHWSLDMLQWGVSSAHVLTGLRNVQLTGVSQSVYYCSGFKFVNSLKSSSQTLSVYPSYALSILPSCTCDVVRVPEYGAKQRFAVL